MEGWQFSSIVTRTTVELPFPPSATGTTAYVTAFWTNSLGQSGPAAAPIKIELPAGGYAPREVSEPVSRLKIAA